jgi:hypothetical protein
MTESDDGWRFDVDEVGDAPESPDQSLRSKAVGYVAGVLAGCMAGIIVGILSFVIMSIAFGIAREQGLSTANIAVLSWAVGFLSFAVAQLIVEVVE